MRASRRSQITGMTHRHRRASVSVAHSFGFLRRPWHRRRHVGNITLREMENRLIRTAWQPVVKVWRRTETGEAPRLQAATYRGERGPAEAGHHAPRDIRSGRSL